MKFKNILMALGLGSMLMTSCTLDEEVYTFISGEDLSADGEYELLVNGAYIGYYFFVAKVRRENEL